MIASLGWTSPTKDLTPKRSSESATDMTQVVLPNDANPLGFMLGGTVDAPHRHRGRHGGPSPRPRARRHRRRRRPAVPPLDQDRRHHHPEGARHRDLQHLARSAGGCVLGGSADRRAQDDDARLPDVRGGLEGWDAGAGAAAHPRHRRRAAEGRGSYRAAAGAPGSEAEARGDSHGISMPASPASARRTFDAVPGTIGVSVSRLRFRSTPT